MTAVANSSAGREPLPERLRDRIEAWYQNLERDVDALEDRFRELEPWSASRWSPPARSALFEHLHGGRAPLNLSYQQLLSYDDHWSGSGVLTKQYRVHWDGRVVYLAIYQGHWRRGSGIARTTRAVVISEGGQIISRQILIREPDGR